MDQSMGAMMNAAHYSTPRRRCEGVNKMRRKHVLVQSHHHYPIIYLLGLLSAVSWLTLVSSLTSISSFSAKVITKGMRTHYYSSQAEEKHNYYCYSKYNNINNNNKHYYFNTALSASNDDNSNNSGGSLIFQSDKNNYLNNLLSSAFLALDETDKYDAVLTGLCSKILDTGGAEKMTSKTKVKEGGGGSMSVDEYVQSAVSPLGVMEQPLNLLQEMNTRRVKASPRCTSALIDVSFYIFNLVLFEYYFYAILCYYIYIT
jgi:hypothetical protein